jgi:hypothetical protein
MIFAFSTFLLGLLTLLNEYASPVTQTVFPLIAGIGLGMLFHAPYQVFARAVKPSELATGTSAFFLVRFTGATVGLVRFDNYLGLSSLIACRLWLGPFSTPERPVACHRNFRNHSRITVCFIRFSHCF